jgi:hypothetical protein
MSFTTQEAMQNLRELVFAADHGLASDMLASSIADLSDRGWVNILDENGEAIAGSDYVALKVIERDRYSINLDQGSRNAVEAYGDDLPMDRRHARQLFAASGWKISAITRAHRAKLEDMIDAELEAAGLMDGTLRIKRTNGDTRLRCKSFYFDNREAVSFESDKTGFIGFAGWADKHNIEPILRAFVAWIDWLGPAKLAA